ncbi:MAG: hypothetical protein K8R45_02450 [Desulfobacterales bacterium]|nr:hypothetical protein [Desulfobacterales bacterium]
MVLEKIAHMLELCNTKSPYFPPTELYNEGWLLRLILQWFASNRIEKSPLYFMESAKWFSEALLPSSFLPRSRKDPLGESWTHADGVIGPFSIGNKGKGDLSLNRDARQFIVLEAKMYSKLSPGVTHASYYDQAARNVGCMAEALCRANRDPNKLFYLAFHVLAPKSQIDMGVFEKNMTYDSIQSKVQRRVEEYGGEKDSWYRDWFKPTLDKIHIACISWEKIIDDIDENDVTAGMEIKQFYQLCQHYNSKRQ